MATPSRRRPTPRLSAFEVICGSLAAGMVAGHYIVRLSLDELRERRQARRAAVR